MAMKCCTKLETVKERCPIVFQGHPSNFKVTRYKTSPILTQIGRFRTIGRSQLSNPSDLPCFRRMNQGYVGHIGTTKIASALSYSIFWMTMWITWKFGNIYVCQTSCKCSGKYHYAKPTLFDHWKPWMHCQLQYFLTLECVPHLTKACLLWLDPQLSGDFISQFWFCWLCIVCHDPDRDSSQISKKTPNCQPNCLQFQGIDMERLFCNIPPAPSFLSSLGFITAPPLATGISVQSCSSHLIGAEDPLQCVSNQARSVFASSDKVIVAA